MGIIFANRKTTKNKIMETNINNSLNYTQSSDESASMSRTFMASVFSWMAAALIITTIMAYYFSHNAELSSLLFTVDSMTGQKGMTGIGILIMLSPLAFVFAISLGINRFSYPVILFLFLSFSAVMGASLSTLFLRYTGASIYTTFASASGMFGLMALVGYTTKTDLTKFGSLMMMGLIGLFIAMLVNFFLNSDAIRYIISFVGVLVFTGLTAYDVQKLKNIGAGVQYGIESTSKLVIMGALDLYLDFINLFLFLLRLFGDRK
jgi:FtsH-binding integral membrane protein